MRLNHILRTLLLPLCLALGAGCGPLAKTQEARRPRLVMFVGVDISGSYLTSSYYDDSVEFLAHYIYSHLHGLGGLDVPETLFVASIGGSKSGEPKTFYPKKQEFEGKSVQEIAAELREMFPKNTKTKNPLTDYNAFFEQVAATVKDKNLVLRPVAIVMVSDGVPATGKSKTPDYKEISLEPLENLSRNVTLRLLYTNADVASRWKNEVPRRRVKVWAQDGAVMVSWKDPSIFAQGQSMDQQAGFFTWVKDNVDFNVRSKRVDKK